MPIFFLFIGILLIVTGINNKIPDLVGLLKDDFKSSGSVPSFQFWILAIFVAGSLGYIKSFKPVANAFLVLIIVSLLLSNKGFFSQFSKAVEGK